MDSKITTIPNWGSSAALADQNATAESTTKGCVALTPRRRRLLLIHLPDQIIDLVFPVAQITPLDVVLELTLPEAARWVAELERPQEVADLLEIWPDCNNLVNH